MLKRRCSVVVVTVSFIIFSGESINFTDSEETCESVRSEGDSGIKVEDNNKESSGTSRSDPIVKCSMNLAQWVSLFQFPNSIK